MVHRLVLFMARLQQDYSRVLCTDPLTTTDYQSRSDHTHTHTPLRMPTTITSIGDQHWIAAHREVPRTTQTAKNHLKHHGACAEVGNVMRLRLFQVQWRQEKIYGIAKKYI